MTIVPDIAIGTLGTMGSSGAGMGAAPAGGSTIGSATASATASAQGTEQVTSWKQVLEQMGVGQAGTSQTADTTGQTAGGRAATVERATVKSQQGTVDDVTVTTQQAAGTDSQQGSATTAKTAGVKTAQSGMQKKDESKQNSAASSAVSVDALTAAALASQAAVQTVAVTAQSSTTNLDAGVTLATDGTVQGGDATATVLAGVGLDTQSGDVQLAAMVQQSAAAGQGQATVQPTEPSSDAAGLVVQQPAAVAADATKAVEGTGIAQVQQNGIAATWNAAGTGVASATDILNPLNTEAALNGQTVAAVQAGTSTTGAATATSGTATGTKLNAAAAVASNSGNESAATVTDASTATQTVQGATGASQTADTRAETRSIAAVQRTSSRVHGAATAEAHTTASGAVVSTQEVSTNSLVRESGVTLANSANAQSLNSPTTAASGLSVHATFAALDSGDVGTTATWTQTGSHTAEAGYHDPVLGWVSVRAQQDASGVHATVIPVSQDAAQSLGTHLAGLNAYLAEHNSAVNTVAIASPDANAAGMSMGQGMSSQSGQGQQSAGQDTTQTSVSFGAAERGGAMSANTAAAAMTPVGSSGTYISVLA